MVIKSLLPAKISVRIYFKLRFYIKKRRLARAYDAVCQHRYLQQTVNMMSCFQGGRAKNKLFVPTGSSSRRSEFIFSKYHTFEINNLDCSSQSTGYVKYIRPFLLVSVPQRQSITQYTISRLTMLGLETAFVLHKFHVPSTLRLNLCGLLNFHAIVNFVIIKAGTK